MIFIFRCHGSSVLSSASIGKIIRVHYESVHCNPFCTRLRMSRAWTCSGNLLAQLGRCRWRRARVQSSSKCACILSYAQMLHACLPATSAPHGARRSGQAASKPSKCFPFSFNRPDNVNCSSLSSYRLDMWIFKRWQSFLGVRICRLGCHLVQKWRINARRASDGPACGNDSHFEESARCFHQAWHGTSFWKLR